MRLIRFLVSGGSAAGVEYAVFLLLQAQLGPGWLTLSQSVSFLCGFVVSFLLNRHWVFASGGRASTELLRYMALAAFNLVASNLALTALVSHAGLHPSLAKFLVMGMVAAWNYVIFARVVFSPGSPSR